MDKKSQFLYQFRAFFVNSKFESGIELNSHSIPELTPTLPTAWPPLPSNLQWVDISHTNPSERKYLVYYLVLSMSNKACHHIHQMKGFYHICFIRLTSMYLCIKKIKSTNVGATCVQGVLP